MLPGVRASHQHVSRPGAESISRRSLLRYVYPATSVQDPVRGPMTAPSLVHRNVMEVMMRAG